MIASKKYICIYMCVYKNIFIYDILIYIYVLIHMFLTDFIKFQNLLDVYEFEVTQKTCRCWYMFWWTQSKWILRSFSDNTRKIVRNFMILFISNNHKEALNVPGIKQGAHSLKKKKKTWIPCLSLWHSIKGPRIACMFLLMLDTVPQKCTELFKSKITKQNKKPFSSLLTTFHHDTIFLGFKHSHRNLVNVS